MVLCCLFLGIRVSVKFHLKCVHIILVRFRLLSGHLLVNSCSARMTICSLCILNIFVITYFEGYF